ncbi:hypothetical protein SAMD00023353_5900380 [Rosellinia necatrix]|uniref:Uncharacterized protein n=1 Tax=Rosellinia necatrix TaxID=77044 RepID=A0A1W2TX22_ROSNE|nr:hypothetical protein SAMD00023353_5900380 [Rosellinia necatrix]
MYFLTVILGTLLPALAAATPVEVTTTSAAATASPTVVRHWTLDEVSRKRGVRNQACRWHMVVRQSSPVSGNSTAADVTCDFQVLSERGFDCSKVPFARTRCSEEDHSSFYVSASHNDNGFVVVLVENLDEDAQAFFGFHDGALDAGGDIAPQTSPATASPYGRGSGGAASAAMLALDDGTEADGQAQRLWRVLNGVHQMDSVKHRVDMAFEIRTSRYATAKTCFLRVYAPRGANLAKLQFYDKKCDGTNFYVSWGYMESSDAGIMTLVGPKRNMMAFFGFPNISASMFLKQAGPSAVLPCSCGQPPISNSDDMGGEKEA